MGEFHIRVGGTWWGQPLAEREVVELWLRPGAGGLQGRFEAPWTGDPPPSGPAGPCPGLWNFEVVELFLLGTDQRYLEVEMGPHGHHLLLELHGRRNVVRQGMSMRYEARLEGDRWAGQFEIPVSLLPRGLQGYNAYAIRGVGETRRYCAAHPLGGERPDFHRLDDFAPWPPTGER